MKGEMKPERISLAAAEVVDRPPEMKR